jgi:CPA2 family monovalent cation:H+ antiporter-2
MNGTHLILVDLATILAVAAVLVLVLGRLRQPAILGFLIAGALVGPSGLGLVSDPSRVDQIAQVGVMLLMFAIGLESSLERLAPVRRFAVGGGLLQIVFTVASVSLALHAFGWALDRAIFLGCILAMSSTTIVLRTLHERGETDAPHGRVALGMLIVQDLAVVPLMIILPTVVTKEGAVVLPALTAIAKAGAALAISLVLARYLVPLVFKQIAKTRSRELFSIAVLGLGVGTAVITDAAGLSLALGAFVAGLALGGTDYEHEARAILTPFRDAFAGVFFVSIGMLLDPRFVLRHPREVIFLVLLVLVGNTIVTILALMCVKAPLRVAVLVGIALSQVGEFSFLIAKMGHDASIFSKDDYEMTVAVSVATMLVTPFTIRLGPPIVALLSGLPWLARTAPAGKIPPDAALSLDRHAILCGYGPIGETIGRGLRENEVPFLALELNPTTVERARREGIAIHYADAAQPGVLEHAGIARAKAVLVTVPDPAGVRAIVREARRRNARAFIVVRTKFASAARDLRELGADEVVVEELEAGLELLARALRRFDVPRVRIEEELALARAKSGSVEGRAIELAPKKLGEITRVLKRVHVEIVDVNEGSTLDGETIEKGVRETTGATVLAVLRGSETIPAPEAGSTLAPGDRIVVFGSPGQVRIVEELGARAGESVAAEDLAKAPDPPA